MATALAGSLDKLLLWGVGLFFTNPKPSLELYTTVIGIYKFHDRTAAVFMTNIGSEPVSLLGLEKRNAIGRYTLLTIGAARKDILAPTL